MQPCLGRSVVSVSSLRRVSSVSIPLSPSLSPCMHWPFRQRRGLHRRNARGFYRSGERQARVTTLGELPTVRISYMDRLYMQDLLQRGLGRFSDGHAGTSCVGALALKP
jgi:hypothetical protein